MFNSKDRIEETLAAIEQGCSSDARVQTNIRQIRGVVQTLGPQGRAAVESALHLGSRSSSPPSASSTEETFRRHAIRACALAEITIKNRQPGQADFLIAQMQDLSVAQLLQRFKTTFPLISSNGIRDTWSDYHFTDPRKHQDSSFRYIVHALKPPWDDVDSRQPALRILGDPTNILRSWTAISCSVINQHHRATYRDFGLILRVPSFNVLTTYGEDQFFKNSMGLYSPRGGPTLKPIQRAAQMSTYVMDKDTQFGGMKTPAEVLHTSGGGVGGINEIIVTGLSPEGRFIRVIGLFLIVDEAGIPVWEPLKRYDKAYVTLEAAMYKARDKFDIPLVKIRQ